MPKRLWMVVFVAGTTFACSSGDGGGEGDDDDDGDAMTPRPDAGGPGPGPGPPDADVEDPDPTQPDAAPPVPQECVVPTTGFGAVGNVAVTAELVMNRAAAGAAIFAHGNLNADAAPDALNIDLYPGYGVFSAGAITAGTFPLTGAELSIVECGACVYVTGDVGEAGPKGMWMATGGTLTLTSVAGQLTGTLANGTFQHVDLGDGATPLGDSCDTSITQAAFNGAITMMP